MGVQQVGDGRLAIEDAFSPDLGGVGGDHRRQDGAVQEGGDLAGVQRRSVFELVQGPMIIQVGLAPRQLIVGDVGELGEDREGADQHQHVSQRQALQALAECDVVGAVPMFAHRVTADVLHALEDPRAVLLLDDLAQQLAEQPYARPALGRTGSVGCHCGLCPGQHGRLLRATHHGAGPRLKD